MSVTLNCFEACRFVLDAFGACVHARNKSGAEALPRGTLWAPEPNPYNVASAHARPKYQSAALGNPLTPTLSHSLPEPAHWMTFTG